MTAEFGVVSQHCVSVWSVSALRQCVVSQHCVSVWTVSTVSVCGQSALCQCGQSALCQCGQSALPQCVVSQPASVCGQSALRQSALALCPSLWLLWTASDYCEQPLCLLWTARCALPVWLLWTASLTTVNSTVRSARLFDYCEQRFSDYCEQPLWLLWTARCALPVSLTTVNSVSLTAVNSVSLTTVKSVSLLWTASDYCEQRLSDYCEQHGALCPSLWLLWTASLTTVNSTVRSARLYDYCEQHGPFHSAHSRRRTREHAVCGADRPQHACWQRLISCPTTERAAVLVFSPSFLDPGPWSDVPVWKNEYHNHPNRYLPSLHTAPRRPQTGHSTDCLV